jgi:ligand-binding sensor domain-containing protein
MEITTVDLPRAKVVNPKPTLSPNRIGSILEDKQGMIWIAVDGYGITKYNPSLSVHDQNAYSFLTKKEGLIDNNIGSLFEDSKGHIWIGSMHGGLSKYNPNALRKEESFINYTKMGLIKGVEVGGLLEDSKGHIWFNVEHYGVYRFDPKAEKEGRNAFTNFTTKDGLATNGVLSIFEDASGSLWFSTWEGVTGYDGSSFFSITEKGPW